MMRQADVEVDAHFSRPDGAMVRIDRIAKGQVYYVAWRAGQSCGRPLRMTVADFIAECRREGMTREA